MIKGAYSFGSIKVDLSKELEITGKIKFQDIYKKTGIKTIYRAGDEENTLTLAIDASKKVLKNIDDEIDSLIFVTQSPISSIPSSGSILHKKLNLKKECYVLDITQGCSGFPYALITAINLIKNKEFKNCLIVCSETYTKYIKKNERSTAPIFSDAASAFYINKKNLPSILSTFFYTDGSGEKNLCLKEDEKGDRNLYMNGTNVFTFTAEKVPFATNKILEKANLTIEEIKYFIFHQASSIVLTTIKDKLKIKNDLFFNDIEEFGNTVSSTIPIALIQLEEKKILPKKQPVLIMGFGVGYSLCGGVFIFD
jgi:3-oxoacyl-[acyl-carrier-protein] synthase III